MPISGRRSTASMLQEMSYQISIRSQLLPATPQLRQLISTNRCRRTTKAFLTTWIMPPPERPGSGAIYSSRPYAGSVCMPTDFSTTANFGYALVRPAR